MRVYSIETLRKFWERHEDSEAQLKLWFNRTKKERWKNIFDVKKIYPSADSVKQWTIFNIKGNKYRLIVRIDYERSDVAIHEVLTHPEYDSRNYN